MQIIGIILQKLYKKLPVISFDVLSIPIAWYLAFLLRYNFVWPNDLPILSVFKALIILMFIQTGCYYYFKVYRGVWRFSSVNDVVRIIKSIVYAVLMTILMLYLTSLLTYIPRSVFPLYGLLLASFLCSGRLLLRTYREEKEQKGEKKNNKRVLIIGAGQAGESLVRDLKRSTHYFPVGFVDDRPSKKGLEIHGVRVLGGTNELSQIVSNYYPIDLLFIAIPSARSATMRRIVMQCEACKIPFRTLPSLSALASGFVQVNALREVKIEDLLGRDEVQLNWDKISAGIHNKHIIVTGGGGSIGSELCRQIMKLKPRCLMIIDNSEFNLYSIHQELKTLYPDAWIDPILISITDAVAIESHFKQFQPHMVFHAAAYKHVPMLENQIRAAVFNNVLGTQIIAEASVAVNAEKFILISTDKAVNPTNVMGTTKRVAEIYCQNLDERVSTRFVTVRFGNVLGSAGSVVPLFQKQLQAGGPLTVTHPDIHRYFMSIPEASQLILQAMANGQGSEIFVLDMGEPIKISYLAEQMIRLAGKTPGKEIAIAYTGLRPGEKLFEELFHESEQLTQTEHEKLFRARMRRIDWDELIQTMRLINKACHHHNDDELHILVKSLVPEFNSQLSPVE